MKNFLQVDHFHKCIKIILLTQLKYCRWNYFYNNIVFDLSMEYKNIQLILLSFKTLGFSYKLQENVATSARFTSKTKSIFFGW